MDNPHCDLPYWYFEALGPWRTVYPSEQTIMRAMAELTVYHPDYWEDA